ncbi:Asp-tRNA(Asn)/Glu-tRNA(Gln) amidotransferase A subunit family amidase [Caldalkalibacillus uzonensis]|uniref:Asp-tRNA(Asn)/Glu-tRNA(Gln) amidotransferase A subunit family amidase n=2 Tax=Caldalkalibacillus uzonensis TaxID=353224 RepID=A0ABU0CP80_9BACI|nr:Asp-tRNA(Asn)/Glu-tRNA(Gln) amidotransferase A subunit family amidase [Caldalkalibacillus uzonensis]
MDKITQLSVRQMAEHISKGVLSPVEIVKAHLEHIDRMEAKIKAWKLIDRRRTLETAKFLAKEARQGRIRSLLHGIPIGVKDNIDVAGLQTQVGSKVGATSQQMGFFLLLQLLIHLVFLAGLGMT